MLERKVIYFDDLKENFIVMKTHECLSLIGPIFFSVFLNFYLCVYPLPVKPVPPSESPWNSASYDVHYVIGGDSSQASHPHPDVHI